MALIQSNTIRQGPGQQERRDLGVETPSSQRYWLLLHTSAFISLALRRIKELRFISSSIEVDNG